MDNYDISTGPAMPEGVSNRSHRTPVDLGRSRRIGLSRQVCQECGAVKGTITRHSAGCSLPGVWVTERTGPLHIGETSKDFQEHSKFSPAEEAALT
jgi:hypothetical protein